LGTPLPTWLRQGVRSAALGVAIGIAGALGLTELLQSQLYGVGARDLSVFAGATLALFLVAILACYVPARATTRLDPIRALREG